MCVGSWLSQGWQLSSTPESTVQRCPEVEKTAIKVFLKYLVYCCDCSRFSKKKKQTRFSFEKILLGFKKNKK